MRQRLDEALGSCSHNAFKGMLLLKHIHTHTSQLSFLHCHVLVFILFRLLQLYPVFPSSILVMYLSTYHVHTEVPHWPDESLCEVESCCQPEAYACLIPIASGHSGPPPRSTITCCISSPSAPPPLWFGKQRVRENHLSMGLHAQKRRSWQVTALAVHLAVGQSKQQRAVSDAAPLTAAPGWLDTHADVMLLLLLLNRHM